MFYSMYCIYKVMKLWLHCSKENRTKSWVKWEYLRWLETHSEARAMIWYWEWRDRDAGRSDQEQTQVSNDEQWMEGQWAGERYSLRGSTVLPLRVAQIFTPCRQPHWAVTPLPLAKVILSIIMLANFATGSPLLSFRQRCRVWRVHVRVDATIRFQ